MIDVRPHSVPGVLQSIWQRPERLGARPLRSLSARQLESVELPTGYGPVSRVASTPYRDNVASMAWTSRHRAAATTGKTSRRWRRLVIPHSMHQFAEDIERRALVCRAAGPSRVKPESLVV